MSSQVIVTPCSPRKELVVFDDAQPPNEFTGKVYRVSVSAVRLDDIISEEVDCPDESSKTAKLRVTCKQNQNKVLPCEPSTATIAKEGIGRPLGKKVPNRKSKPKAAPASKVAKVTAPAMVDDYSRLVPEYLKSDPRFRVASNLQVVLPPIPHEELIRLCTFGLYWP